MSGRLIFREPMPIYTTAAKSVINAAAAKRYALAGDELFILFDFYWVLLQLYHTFVIRE